MQQATLESVGVETLLRLYGDRLSFAEPRTILLAELFCCRASRALVEFLVCQSARRATDV